MRWFGLIVWLAASAAQAKPSNPAFLGIEMIDVQRQVSPTGASVGPSLGPCLVRGVTRGSGAKAAGLTPDDILATIDGTPVTNCAAVLTAVQAHEAGDIVKIKVLRYGRPITLTATLVSRDEILRRRFVGQVIGSTEVFGVDDRRSYDLGSLRGTTSIVGWFDARHCADCSSVFAKVAAWSRAQDGKTASQLMPLAVTAMEPGDATALRSIALDVPLAVADPALYDEFTIPDTERIHFMVVDCRGVVQYIAPIAPNGDDTDAVLDELFAAASQALRRSSKSAAR